MADGRHRIEAPPAERPSPKHRGSGLDLLLGRRSYHVFAGYRPMAGNAGLSLLDAGLAAAGPPLEAAASLDGFGIGGRAASRSAPTLHRGI